MNLSTHETAVAGNTFFWNSFSGRRDQLREDGAARVHSSLCHPVDRRKEVDPALFQFKSFLLRSCVTGLFSASYSDCPRISRTAVMKYDSPATEPRDWRVGADAQEGRINSGSCWKYCETKPRSDLVSMRVARLVAKTTDKRHYA